MNLSAINSPKGSVGLGSTLFKDVRPLAEKVAKSLPAAPVKPVALPAPAGRSIESVLSVVRAMNAGIEQLAAAIKAPVQKAAPAVPPAAVPAAPASTLNVMLGSDAKRGQVAKTAEAAAREPAPARHPSTEGQLRREAEARELARKNAAQADAERVQVKRAGGRVRVLKQLDPSLSNAALMALSHVVTKWEANGRQSVPINAPDLAHVLDLPLVAAQAGFAELVNKGHVKAAKNTIGVTLVTPSRAATGEA